MESTIGAKCFQKGINLRLQGIVTLPQADGPAFLLKRLKQRLGGVAMALPMAKYGHLIVDESLGFALNDFQHARVLFLQNKDSRMLDVALGIELAGAPLFNSDRAPRLVNLFDRANIGAPIHQQAQARPQVRLRKRYRLRTPGWGRHR